MTERAQYDGTELDEVVAEGVTFHLEQLDVHGAMIRVHRPATATAEAVDVHLSVLDVSVVELAGLPRIERESVVYCHRWTDSRGRGHACYGDHQGEWHECTCGELVLL